MNGSCDFVFPVISALVVFPGCILPDLTYFIFELARMDYDILLNRNKHMWVVSDFTESLHKILCVPKFQDDLLCSDNGNGKRLLATGLNSYFVFQELRNLILHGIRVHIHFYCFLLKPLVDITGCFQLERSQ